MKNFILLCIIVMLCSVAVTAQENDNGRGIFAEMGAGFDNSDAGGTYGYISPKVGFTLNQLLNFGVITRFDLGNKYTSFWANSYGGFIELSTKRKHGFSALLELKATSNRDGESYMSDGRKEYYHHFTEIGLTPGIRYTLPWYGLSVSIKYAFVGFSDSEDRHFDSRTGVYRDGKLLVDGRFRRLEFAVRYTFGF